MTKKFWIVVSAPALGLLSCGAALAEDMTPPPVYDWTGIYMGLNAGVAWNNSSANAKVDPLNCTVLCGIEDKIESNQSVFEGGGQIGYNWQYQSVVLGLATDLNWLNLDSSMNRDVGPLSAHLDLNSNWYGTLRGRLGFAADNFLFYGTGGAAYGHINADGKFSDGIDTWKASESNTNWGWTIGAGAEYAVDSNWIVGAEYQYVNLGSPNLNFGGPLSDKVSGSIDVKFGEVRAIIEYKF
jgi:outer membrane immunogenic protein